MRDGPGPPNKARERRHRNQGITTPLINPSDPAVGTKKGPNREVGALCHPGEAMRYPPMTLVGAVTLFPGSLILEMSNETS